MVFVAIIRCDDLVIRGKGDTRDAAHADCERELQQTVAELRSRMEIQIDLGGSIFIPDGTPVPSDLPEGMGLLVMIRASHNDGEAYERRIFALPHGTHALSRSGIEESQDCVIGPVPTSHYFLDCNSDYEYPLPEGSMEFIEGDWYACKAAAYDY